MNQATASLKQRLGCWVRERLPAEVVLCVPNLARMIGLSWMDLRNRHERLRADAVSGGRICEWRDSSQLTVARVFPESATRLLTHALRDWPIRFNAGERTDVGQAPVVSILIPVGGTERLAQFELTLQAARAQLGVAFEIIVVEQATERTLESRLPADVRYQHQPNGSGEGFNKSRALNLGARVAHGDVLIILDADYLMPTCFASECARVLVTAEAARPARWIFYLDRPSSEQLAITRDCGAIAGVEHIVSNNPTPLAIRRSTYWEIGGHDESYVGWGGEDTEFLDRLRTRNISEGGWMPVLHVWHAPAPKKADGDRNRAQHAAKMAISATERIRALVDADAEVISS